MSPLGRDRKAREGSATSSLRGGVDAGGSEAAAAVGSISKEAAATDTTDCSRVVGCVGSVILTGGRPRWLMIRRSMAFSIRELPRLEPSSHLTTPE